MSLYRVNPKRDQSERAIVEALESCGCMVVRLSGRDTPDLLCGTGGRWLVLEAKTGRAKLTEGQSVFFQRAKAKGLPAYVVTTAEEALELVARVNRL